MSTSDQDQPDPSTLPRLSRLIGAGRTRGIDMRPALLRVIVDQFIAEPRHTPAEITRFGELANRLMDRSTVEDRLAVAARLADHTATPASLIRRLAMDVPDVAVIVLSRSAALTEADLMFAVVHGSPALRAAVAGRPDLTPAVEAALAGVGLARPVPVAEPPPVQDDSTGLSFLDSDPEGRARQLARLARTTFEDVDQILALKPADTEAARQVELAALSRQDGALSRSLARALGLPLSLAERVVLDPHGEPLIVCLKALDTGLPAAIRVVLFANPVIGSSTQIVPALARLYDALPVTAALALIADWRTGQSPRRPPTHQPVLSSDATDRTDARRASTPQARPSLRPAQPGLRPAARSDGTGR